MKRCFVRLEVTTGTKEQVARQLCMIPGITAYVISGTCDVLVLVESTRDSFRTTVEAIRMMEGVEYSYVDLIVGDASTVSG